MTKLAVLSLDALVKGGIGSARMCSFVFRQVSFFEWKSKGRSRRVQGRGSPSRLRWLRHTSKAILKNFIFVTTICLTTGLQATEESPGKDTNANDHLFQKMTEFKAYFSRLGAEDYASRQVAFDWLVGRVRVLVLRIKILQLCAKRKAATSDKAFGSNTGSEGADEMAAVSAGDTPLVVFLAMFAKKEKIAFRLEDKSLGKLCLRQRMLNETAVDWAVVNLYCDHYGLFVDEADSKEGVYVLRKCLDRVHVESLLTGFAEGRTTQLPWLKHIAVDEGEELRRGCLLLLLLIEEMQKSVDPEVTKMLRSICKKNGLPCDLKCPSDGIKGLLKFSVPYNAPGSSPTPAKPPDQSSGQKPPPNIGEAGKIPEEQGK